MSVNGHRTVEFIELLELLNGRYPKGAKIRIVLDNHSAKLSRKLQAFLEKMPDRFEFVFNPKQEFVDRIEQYLSMVNAEPVAFRWRAVYGNTVSTVRAGRRWVTVS